MPVAEFSKILLCNSDFLKPFAFTLTRDKEAAKDLTQDTLFKALAYQEKYNFGTNIKAWLYTIMRNTFINSYRIKNYQKVSLDFTQNAFLINQKSVRNGAEGDLLLKQIQNAIYQLPDTFKQPFTLYFEGFKYNEIARMLNEPLGTVKSRIYFARKLLRAELSSI